MNAAQERLEAQRSDDLAYEKLNLVHELKSSVRHYGPKEAEVFKNFMKYRAEEIFFYAMQHWNQSGNIGAEVQRLIEGEIEEALSK